METAPASGLVAWLRLLRPRQWTKNLIVFAAPLFAFRIDRETVLSSGLAFVMLCLASSAFYVFNDIADRRLDREHPRKRYRPIAAGTIRVPVAAVFAGLLLAGVLTASWLHSQGLGAIVTTYAALQLLYNVKLKDMVILDVMSIATGFVLRAVAGAAATDLPVSGWFLLCTALLALFLGFEKRKAELRVLGGRGGVTRAVLARYSLPLLARMETIAAAGAVITYAIWSSGPQVEGASTPWMLVTIPFVLYGVFRYQWISTPPEDGGRPPASHEHVERAERPEEILLGDPGILITTAGWALTSFLIMLLDQRGLLP